MIEMQDRAENDPQESRGLPLPDQNRQIYQNELIKQSDRFTLGV